MKLAQPQSAAPEPLSSIFFSSEADKDSLLLTQKWHIQTKAHSRESAVCLWFALCYNNTLLSASSTFSVDALMYHDPPSPGPSRRIGSNTATYKQIRACDLRSNKQRTDSTEASKLMSEASETKRISNNSQKEIK